MSSRRRRERKRFFAHPHRHISRRGIHRLRCSRMRCLLFLAIAFCLTGKSFAQMPIPKTCGQAVCVTTPSWASPAGTLQRWERAGDGAPWKMAGPPVAVLVGEHGLAWGLGLHRVPERDDGPRKKEGDRRAPAGIFPLTMAFGLGPDAVGRLPWQPITASLEAIDDPASRFYNRIVDRRIVTKPDWHSSEHMAAIPDYALGVVVAHNPRNIPGAGSCIFLHLWRGARNGTAGCTVLRQPDLFALVSWLDATRHPVLIQLPQTEGDWLTQRRGGAEEEIPK